MLDVLSSQLTDEMNKIKKAQAISHWPIDECSSKCVWSLSRTSRPSLHRACAASPHSCARSLRWWLFVLCYGGFICLCFNTAEGQVRDNGTARGIWFNSAKHENTFSMFHLWRQYYMRARTQHEPKIGELSLVSSHNVLVLTQTHTRARLLYQPNPTCNIVTFFGRVYCVLSMAKRHYDARIQCLGPPSFGYFSTARRRHHLIEYYVIPILFFILLFFALFYAMLRKLLRSHRLSLLGIVLSLLVRAAALDMNLWFHV